MDGRLLLAGVDAASLPMRRLLNVVFVLFTEQITEVNRDAILERAEAALGEDNEISRDTWGSSPAYVAQQRTIMSAYGPAPGWSERVKADR